MGTTSIMVFTRDLRVRDNPALCAAVAAADTVVPLFVLDDSLPIASSANRLGFLAESLRDLDASLRGLGGRLLVRQGPWVDEVMAVASASGATSIHLAADVSAYAQRRLDRLCSAAADRVAVTTHPGVTVVPPGAVVPASADGPRAEFKVFTPYMRRWLAVPWRPVLAPPPTMQLPTDLEPEGLDVLDALDISGRSPNVIPGGETEGLARLKAWAADHLGEYAARHNDLAADATSHISAYLHFGCLSPNEVATRLRNRSGGGPFVRQLCWRDFYHQLLAARPDAGTSDYRPRGDQWQVDDEAFEAWRTGQTGYPVVDAAMRQLVAEGFMHNRARMVVASFLTKDLYLDWRLGAAHFMALLVDGDVANNQLNWQWTAGTGTDPNAHRVFNPVLQGQRFDPDGEYIRRYLPELADLTGDSIHWPDETERRRRNYPAPIVDHRDAVAAYRAARQRST